MEDPTSRTRIAVIGVGNEFRHDDATGWAVIAALARRSERHALPHGTTLSVCDGEPARLITLWEGAELAVVIDSAVATPARPGHVHRLELDGDGTRVPDVGIGSTSSHGLGLGDAVELARTLDRLPGRLIVYAVEGADESQGVGLTDPVAAAVEPLAETVAAELARHARTARGAVRPSPWPPSPLPSPGTTGEKGTTG
ncbi:hydrogenase maturation protease [Streptomyces beihaiensis]|uniref:Hydrogenase maturation protease n=1 Tax=Streptomyces beihaiensis TaxID=2984495 RepID=A0ABT3TV49_9ACTN|nr:hydrogenase maturation protease [Streptomyces beihaiensis]MCX3059950.1 hydrogenase maturation protease [Streptomyces beihaiensis]